MYSRALRVALQNARNLRLISILKHLRLYAHWRDCSRTTRPFLATICPDITRMPTIFARITRVLSLLPSPHLSIFIIYPSSLPSFVPPPSYFRQFALHREIGIFIFA